MFEIFESYIKANGDFTTKDVALLRALAIVKKIPRREMLLQEGDVCRYKFFVEKGLLRSYCVKEDGTEHILRFAAENCWTTDHESLKHQVPSTLFIESIEPSEVVMWTYENLNALYKSIPALKSYMERLLEKTLKASQERILINLSYSSEEKYEDFVSAYPDVFQRVPLHMVAAYLGVSRETLSRIRQARVKA